MVHTYQKTTVALCPHRFLVGHGTKLTKNANIWPKMTKNAYFGPNLAVFGPKILTFTGESKSFGTHITENHLGTSFICSLVRHSTKCDQNASILPKMPILGQKWVIFQGSPGFLAISGGGRQNRGGTVRTTKKMTHIVNGSCPGRNYRETAVLRFAVFAPKSVYL